MSSNLVPHKNGHVGERDTLNQLRAQTRPPSYVVLKFGVGVPAQGSSLSVAQNYEDLLAKLERRPVLNVFEKIIYLLLTGDFHLLLKCPGHEKKRAQSVLLKAERFPPSALFGVVFLHLSIQSGRDLVNKDAKKRGCDIYVFLLQLILETIKNFIARIQKERSGDAVSLLVE
ncbi:hypothetical protein TNCV_1992921 [Trichonephila clavipes]|nr:hypothetical protein TNCV_1992921 [Trichonephila clavipes]